MHLIIATLKPDRSQVVTSDPEINPNLALRGNGKSGMERQTRKRRKGQFHRGGIVITISGVDGSGKTTLVAQLAERFQKAGWTVQPFHVHSWLLNITVMPFRMWRAKSAGTVSILDRSVYDNIAVLLSKRHIPLWLARRMIQTANLLYQSIDLKIVLTASPDELMARRPEESKELLLRKRAVYEVIAKQGDFTVFQSAGDVESRVIDLIESTINPDRHNL